MQTSLPLWCSGLAALAVLTSSTGRRADEPPASQGHLILLVEGDATRLSVTHATSKPDPFGGVRRGLVSDYQIALLTAKGTELGRYPIDLSRFDLDPTRVGGPVRVEGCVVRDPAVALLVNVPNFVDAAQVRIHRKGVVIGRLEPEAFQGMLPGRTR